MFCEEKEEEKEINLLMHAWQATSERPWPELLISDNCSVTTSIVKCGRALAGVVVSRQLKNEE